MLEDLGLVPALQILVADTRQASGIEVTINTDSDLADLPAHIATTSYRVVAEGLANVVRHSRGSACTIHLSRIDHQLTSPSVTTAAASTRRAGGDGLTIDRRTSERGRR